MAQLPDPRLQQIRMRSPLSRKPLDAQIRCIC